MDHYRICTHANYAWVCGKIRNQRDKMILRFSNDRQGGAIDVPTLSHESFDATKVPAEQVRVRPYSQSDWRAIRHLCCETGLLGKPIEPLFHDRELFADLFTRPYLESEPEWALVAEAEGRVVGYLLGAVSPGFEWHLLRSGFRTACRMLWRLFSGHYAQHAPSQRFVRWLLTVGYREQPGHPPSSAHFHWDLEQRFRGRGLAQRLWSVYEERLRDAGVARCYGCFFSCVRRRPELVYARYGFTVFDRRPTTLFASLVQEPVEVVCVQRTL